MEAITHSACIELQASQHDALPQSRQMRMLRTRLAGPSRPVRLVPLHLNANVRYAQKHTFAQQRKFRQHCCSGRDRSKDQQVSSCLTYEHSSYAHASAVNGKSQQERILSFEHTPDGLDVDEAHHHDLDINDSTVHQVLAWIFSRLGLLQLAAQLRGKAWSAITVACLMAVALLTAWAGGTQAVSAQICSQISTAATAAIYLLAGIPELVDLCFDLTAGHIDTHVLMTLAVFGTLAIGGALEVMFAANFASSPCLITRPAHMKHLPKSYSHTMAQIPLTFTTARPSLDHCSVISTYLAESCCTCAGRFAAGVV